MDRWQMGRWGHALHQVKYNYLHNFSYIVHMQTCQGSIPCFRQTGALRTPVLLAGSAVDLPGLAQLQSHPVRSLVTTGLVNFKLTWKSNKQLASAS